MSTQRSVDPLYLVQYAVVMAVLTHNLHLNILSGVKRNFLSFLLELLQSYLPDKHALLPELVLKYAGRFMGMAMGKCWNKTAGSH